MNIYKFSFYTIFNVTYPKTALCSHILALTSGVFCCLTEIRPQCYKTFSTQLSMKFTMLMNVKMPTIDGILTFISMINTPSESSET